MTPTNEAGHGLPAGIIERLAAAKDQLPRGSDERKAVWQAIEYLRTSGTGALSRGVPADMVLVPREPTDEMVDAGRVAVMALDCCGPKWTVRKHYEASGADPAGIPDELLDAICPMPKADRAELVYRAMLAAAPAAAGAQGEVPNVSDVLLKTDDPIQQMRMVVQVARENDSLISRKWVEGWADQWERERRLTTPQPAAADGGVRERALEMLSQAYREAGFEKAATWVSQVDLDSELYVLDRAVVGAIEAALSSHRQAGDDLSSLSEMAASMANFADVADACTITEGNAQTAIRSWRNQILALIEKGAGNAD